MPPQELTYGDWNADTASSSNVDIQGDTFTLATAIPDSGVARWTFDDAGTEGGTALDAWGNNDGTINGATTGASGANQTYTTNEAYSFDGQDDDVFDTLSSPSHPTGQFSYACWVYMDDTNTGGFMSADGSTGTAGFSTTVRYGTSLEVGAYDGSNYQIVNGPNLNTGTWYHIVTTFNIGGDITLYVDSANEGSVSISNLDGLTNDFHIGFEAQQGHKACDIDDPRIYDKELTSTEVSNLYNTGSING